jgi:hypothetical protein
MFGDVFLAGTHDLPLPEYPTPGTLPRLEPDPQRHMVALVLADLLAGDLHEQAARAGGKVEQAKRLGALGVEKDWVVAAVQAGADEYESYVLWAEDYAAELEALGCQMIRPGVWTRPSETRKED